MDLKLPNHLYSNCHRSSKTAVWYGFHLSVSFAYQNKKFLFKLYISELFSVAFHAVINGDPVINRGDKVKFNLVTLSDGNGYIHFQF